MNTKYNLTLVSLLLALTSLTACGRALTSPVPQQPQYRAQTMTIQPIAEQPQILVRFKPHVTQASIQEFLAKYGVRIVKTMPALNLYGLVPDSTVGLKPTRIVEYMEEDPRVVYAEVNDTVEIFSLVDYNTQVGQQVDLSGIYRSSRSGAIIEANGTRLSVVDEAGRVLPELQGLPDNSRVKIMGIVKKVKGFNLTEGLGIMPINFFRAE